MEAYGFVKQITDDKALVNVVRESSCGGNCAACNACGNREIELLVSNPVQAEIGDFVRITSSSKQVLQSIFLLYVLPVLLFLTICLICSIWVPVLPATLLAIGAMVVFYFLIRKWENRLIVHSEITDIVHK